MTKIEKKGVEMNLAPIYTVTTVRHSLMAGKRSVGFFHELEMAEDYLENNAYDINECGYYPYAVVEEVKPGFYTFPRTEFWFRWDVDNERYIKMLEKPDRFKKSCGWSLG